MKVGSLVECVELFESPHEEHQNYIVPVKGNIYTVREIRKETDYGVEFTTILLEECVNPKFTWNGRHDEASFPVEGFREIQPPMTIELSELISQTIEV